MNELAATGLPAIGDLVKGYYGQLNANRDRALQRRQLGDNEQNSKFQRLLALMNQSQNMQGNMAAGQRLLSLQNAV